MQESKSMGKLLTNSNIAIHKMIMLIAASAFCIVSIFLIKGLLLQSQTKFLAKELRHKEFGIWLFQKNYNNLPGNIPNATQLWSVNSFKKNCLYSINGLTIDNRLIIRGFNGSGNGLVSLHQITNNYSDPAIETSIVNCHLILAGIYKPNKQELVIGNFAHTPLGKSPKGVWQNKNFAILLLGADRQADQVNLAKAKNFLYIAAPIFSKIPLPMQIINARLSSKVLRALDNKIDTGKPGAGFLKMYAKSNGLGDFRPCCSAADPSSGLCKPEATYVNNNSKNACYAQYNARVL